MKIYGLIGYPLSHSFSQAYFSEKFKKENIHDCRFDLFPLEQIKTFSLFINQQQNLRGLAVTIPHKESILPFISELDEIAEEVNAVNCIAFNSSELKGYNTDVIGFEKSLQPLLKAHHNKAIVLGAGGASKAVTYVLKKMGIDFIIASRGEIKNRQMISYENIDDDLINEYKLIINCTPIGQFPNVDDSISIPYNAVGKDHLFYDLIYNPTETQFLKSAKSKGAVIKNGIEMLELQAEENWRIWNQS